MKLISTVVRPERLPQVKAALFRAGVTGITISRVSGHGGERELQEHYRGGTVVLEFREKVRLEMGVSEAVVGPTIKAVLSSAPPRPGGGGENFVPPPGRAVKDQNRGGENGAGPGGPGHQGE